MRFKVDDSVKLRVFGFDYSGIVQFTEPELVVQWDDGVLSVIDKNSQSFIDLKLLVDFNKELENL